MDFFAGESFAVVDLETTGTRKEEGDRIIQFGCAIVKDGEVVKTYSFMMNPHRKIPLAVTNLTGIDQKMVAGQADFKHYAPKIREILQDTVFVAHNVNFDFPFLNYELTNAGFEPLTCKAVDTVELAKIAFPTLPSYKLRDLTASLEIKHANPHKADSDAYGTAVLLLKIIDKLASLPQATLNVLGSLASGLIRDTGDVIKVIADQSRQSRRKLPKDKMQVRNLVLKRQEIPAVEHGENGHFPVKDTDKRKLFKGKINYRQAQVDLIDRLHDFVEDAGQRVMLAEAPNGTGKTFAYLFAYAYQLYSGKKISNCYTDQGPPAAAPRPGNSPAPAGYGSWLKRGNGQVQQPLPGFRRFCPDSLPEFAQQGDLALADADPGLADRNDNWGHG